MCTLTTIDYAIYRMTQAHARYMLVLSHLKTYEAELILLTTSMTFQNLKTQADEIGDHLATAQTLYKTLEKTPTEPTWVSLRQAIDRINQQMYMMQIYLLELKNQPNRQIKHFGHHLDDIRVTINFGIDVILQIQCLPAVSSVPN